MYNLMVMKMQILNIEPYDNLPSLLDRITNTGTDLLVLTTDPLPDWLENPIAIELLGRKAISEGKRIGIILKDSPVKGIFEENGILVFEDETSAQHERWRDLSPVGFSKDKTRKHSRSLIRPEKTEHEPLSKFSKGVIASIGLVFFLVLLALVLPSARVMIVMKHVTTPMEFPILVSPEYPDITLTGNIPATVRTFSVSQISTIPTSGQALLPKTYATGEVIFTNLTDQEQFIPAGIQVSTAGNVPVFFITETDARLEGKAGAELAVRITAQAKGDAGNTGSGTITRINSILGSQLTVRNDTPTSGGSAEMVNIASPLDRNAIRAKVLEEINIRTQNQAQGSLKQGEILVPQSFRVSHVLSEEYFPETGQPGSTISLQMEATTQILVVRQADLADYFNQVVGLGLPELYRSIPTDGQDLQLTCQKSGRVDQFTCTLSGNRQIAVTPSKEEILAAVWGRDRNQVERSLLETYPDIEQIQINQNLDNWPWLPFLPNRLEVEIQ